MNIDQCYTILELSRNATLTYLKANYRRLVLKYHPDRNNGDSTQFKLIQEAYETLSKHLLQPVVQERAFDPYDFTYSGTTMSYQTWTTTASG